MRTWFQSGDALCQSINTFLPPDKSTAVWHIGQCGEIFKINHSVILVDPVLGPISDGNGLIRTEFAPPFSPNCSIPIHAVFCTHGHIDHLHPETISGIAKYHPETQFYFPAGIKEETRLLWKSFPDRVTFLRQGDRLTFLQTPALSVAAVAQPHDTYQTDENGNMTALGYIFQFDGITVYHAGDTVVTSQLVQEILHLGPIDAAFLPINGRDWLRESQNIIGNMTPEEAALFAEAIQARIVFPTHHDLITGNLGNPSAFGPIMDRLYPNRPYHFLKPGEFYLLRTHAFF